MTRKARTYRFTSAVESVGSSTFLPRPTFFHVMRTESEHSINRLSNEIAAGKSGMVATYGGMAQARNQAVLFAAQDTHYSVSQAERVRLA